jgi:hypothetical protein
MATERNLHIFTMTLLVFVFGLQMLFNLQNLFADSPSFSTNTVTDAKNDATTTPLIGEPECNNLLQWPNSIPDIRSVTYNSDGKFLNLTMWFSSPEKRTPSLDSTVYTVGLGFLPGNGTHLTTDHFLSVHWGSPFKKSWMMDFNQISGNDSKVIYQDLNYTELFDTSQLPFVNKTHSNHINLFIDLKKLSYPQEYFLIPIIADMQLENNGLCGLFDVIDRIIIVPKSDPRIFLSENPVYMYNGHEKTVQLKINSSTLERADIIIDMPKEIEGISTELVPHSITVGPGEAGFSDLNLKANSEPKLYSIPIQGTVSYPKIDLLDFGKYIFPSHDSNKDQSGKIPTTKNITINTADVNMKFALPTTYLTVSINPFSFEDWWRVYGGFLSTVLSFAGGGVTIWALNWIVQNRKK